MPRRAARPLLPLALAAIVPIISPAHAESDCADAASTVEINVCFDKEYQAADKALNAAYEAAIAYIRTQTGEKPYDAASFEAAMRNAQRAWVAYRDADCKDLVAQEWSGGSGTTSAILGCMTEKTVQRTKELKDRFTER
ncbi:lysozyme inhibitor LprI family protein [Hyphomicrobium sp.]|uniref:lysozyme inhibitor LprI family protein n=1 Tax=Hyphomicrobium sp. TaxID=82 RepID=UPI002D7767BF|nr:lysozyme inhibitor LprI family protein [Hyphomicrobium sp.]HET6388058.1 lysozyme inhibitor LprI family protein [Hyphomicrobium sp.]